MTPYPEAPSDHPTASGSSATPPRSEDEAPPRTHRRIPAAIWAAIGFCLGWFVPMGWLAYWGHTDTVLIMLFVTVFAAVALGLPWLLMRVGRGHAERASDFRPRQWLRGQLDTFTGRLPAWEAALLILLPLAAVANGITLMGVALSIAAHGG